MSQTIQDYFDNAQLSQASYASLEEGMTPDVITAALKGEQEGAHSAAQASKFASQYSIVHAQQNTSNGFSCTLLKDSAGQYTFAARRTEGAYKT